MQGDHRFVVRHAVIANKNFKFSVLEKIFSSLVEEAKLIVAKVERNRLFLSRFKFELRGMDESTEIYLLEMAFCPTEEDADEYIRW